MQLHTCLNSCSPKDNMPKDKTLYRDKMSKDKMPKDKTPKDKMSKDKMSKDKSVYRNVLTGVSIWLHAFASVMPAAALSTAVRGSQTLVGGFETTTGLACAAALACAEPCLGADGT